MAEPPLFAYGTLLTGACDPSVRTLVRRHCEPIGRAWIQARLYDLGPYPAAVASSAARDRVYGVLLRVTDGGLVWPRLDRFEDFDPAAPETSLFVREQVVATPDRRGPAVPAWTYLFNRPTRAAVRVPGGDYLRHLRRARRSATIETDGGLID